LTAGTILMAAQTGALLELLKGGFATKKKKKKAPPDADPRRPDQTEKEKLSPI
jgi:hypothetical protein